jgi:hypothetical protein
MGESDESYIMETIANELLQVEYPDIKPTLENQ